MKNGEKALTEQAEINPQPSCAGITRGQMSWDLWEAAQWIKCPFSGIITFSSDKFQQDTNSRFSFVFWTEKVFFFFFNLAYQSSSISPKDVRFAEGVSFCEMETPFVKKKKENIYIWCCLSSLRKKQSFYSYRYINIHIFTCWIV